MPFGRNPNACAWIEPIPRDLTKVPGFGRFAITGICRSCGRALANGSRATWVDVMGYEGCPTPWLGETAMHRAIAVAPVPVHRRAPHLPTSGGHAA